MEYSVSLGNCKESNNSCRNANHAFKDENNNVENARTDSQTGEHEHLDHLEIETIAIVGESVEKLFLWGQSACVYNGNQIIIFGGFGGLGRHSRRNDLLVLDLESRLLNDINIKGSPSPRLGHTCSVVGDNLFLIGGRNGPIEILNDVWSLDLVNNKWTLLQCLGTVFPPRHRHAAAVVGRDIYVFGGLNTEFIYSSMHIFNTETLQWSEVNIQGEWPSARHSHCLVAIDSYLFTFGGYDGDRALGDLYSFDVQNFTWRNIEPNGRTPFPRFSHSMFVYKNYLGVLGGCPLRQGHHEIALFDLIHRIWKNVSIGSVGRELLIHSSVNVVNDNLVIVGGGVSCYAFGTKFDPPMKICLRSATSIKSHKKNNWHLLLCNETLRNKNDFFNSCFNRKLSMDKEPLFNRIGGWESNKRIEGERLKPMVLQLEKKYAKLGKDTLKKFGWLDLGRMVYSDQDGCLIYFPVNHLFMEQTALCWADKSNTDASYLVRSLPTKGLPVDKISHPKAIGMLLSCGGLIVIDHKVTIKKVPKSPKELMREAVHFLLECKGFPLSMLEQLPTRWERLGDIVVLPVSSFKESTWDSFIEELWPVVAKSLGARRLARQGYVTSAATRDSTLEILVGTDGWVNHQENGILYSFDATKCMFSSGNLSEKLRMAQLDCNDEIVVDLFAGIGYFTLPLLVKSKAKLLYACEWNPHAIEALKCNVQANGVADRCIILQGDNRVTSPKGIADRICLGLLPTSEGSWLTAVQALKIDGGVLHVHGNVNDSDEKSWSEYVVRSINEIAKREGRCWDVSIEHLERVKWYGPHIRHLVADVRCKCQCSAAVYSI